jgi:carboxymethylenebutenolidase
MSVTTRDVVIPGAVAAGFLAMPAQGQVIGGEVSSPAHQETRLGNKPPSGFLKARGAVVVCHEIFGRAPELERVCVRFAEAGYAALMPDLFGQRFKPLCIARALREIASGQGEFIDVIVSAADVVAACSGVARERVGVIGFCLGGGFALATGKVFWATSTNYGDLPPVDVLSGIGPTIGCYGASDRIYRHTGAALAKRLALLDVEHEIHTFDAGHAFLTDGDHPAAETITRFALNVNATRDAAVREQAWEKILSFFDRHLIPHDP